MTDGQWMLEPDGSRWLFDTGALCLELVNTGELGTREQLGSPGALERWLADRFGSIEPTVAARDLQDAHALRAAIAGITTATLAERPADPDDVDTLNLYAATPDIPPALDGGRRRAGRSTARAGQAYSGIARDAIALFSGTARERLRECSASDCALVFYDESRSNNRRWCSMARCGNRSKVRAHRARATA